MIHEVFQSEHFQNRQPELINELNINATEMFCHLLLTTLVS